MIDEYVILNRKPNFIIKLFIFNFFLLTGLVIFGINTFSYQNYFHIHSRILNLNSYFYLEVLVPVKEVNKISQQNLLWVDSKSYYYTIYSIDKEVVYLDHINYLKVYLEVNSLDKDFQRNGYHLDIRIKNEKKKIIDYLNKKEV